MRPIFPAPAADPTKQASGANCSGGLLGLWNPIDARRWRSCFGRPMTGTRRFRSRRLLEEHGVSLAMVTLGSEGCLLANAGDRVRVRGPRVTPVDTTGAGDIFGGSAVSRLLELGKEPAALNREELLYVARFAVTAASLSTQVPGGIPSIPDRAAVERAMQTLEEQPAGR